MGSNPPARDWSNLLYGSWVPRRACSRKFLKSWCTAALRSRLEPLRKFVRTIKKHHDNIITFIESGGLTNAIAEGINRIIKIVKNRASGFRSVQAFTDLIYLVVGDIDIPAQIPARFRTL